MFKRKLLSQVMSAALASSVLMGCDSSDSDSNDTDPSGAPESAVFKMTLSTDANEGKSTLQLTVTDVDDDPVVGVVPMMMPMMTMTAGHQHSTPHTGCTATNDSGVADCTAYFLMGSTMANGNSMGEWDLKFTVSADGKTDSTVFNPDVMMAMGDTKRATLKGGVDDQIPAMMEGMMEARSYYIFNNGLSGMGDMRSVELFISAKESMMSYPALTSVELNEGTANALTPTPVSVEVSANNADWVTAASAGAGIYNATNLAGLVDGTAGKIYVKLSVAGEQKTVDGAAPGVDNVSAQFSVTPGAAMAM